MVTQAEDETQLADIRDHYERALQAAQEEAEYHRAAADDLGCQLWGAEMTALALLQILKHVCDHLGLDCADSLDSDQPSILVPTSTAIIRTIEEKRSSAYEEGLEVGLEQGSIHAMMARDSQMEDT